jgi:hypothetical protein
MGEDRVQVVNWIIIRWFLDQRAVRREVTGVFSLASRGSALNAPLAAIWVGEDIPPDSDRKDHSAASALESIPKRE